MRRGVWSVHETTTCTDFCFYDDQLYDFCFFLSFCYTGSMNPEERKLLEKTLQLTVENNLILHKQQRAARWGTAFRIIYWVFIIGASLGAYILIQPYVDQIKGLYSEVRGSAGAIQEMTQKTSVSPR